MDSEIDEFERKLDNFSSDYFHYLTTKHALHVKYNLKVLTCCQHRFQQLIPTPLHPYRDHFQGIYVLWLSKRNLNHEPTYAEKVNALIAVGYPAELAQQLADYNVLILLDLENPIRRQNGETLVPNIPISHHLLHLVEALTDKQLIPEQPMVHDYELNDALQPFRDFTAHIGGIDNLLDRYIPCLATP